MYLNYATQSAVMEVRCTTRCKEVGNFLVPIELREFPRSEMCLERTKLAHRIVLDFVGFATKIR